MLRRLQGLHVQILLWTVLPLTVVLIVLALLGIARHRQTMIDLIAERNRGVVLVEAGRLAQVIALRGGLLAQSAAALAIAPDRDERWQMEFPAGLVLFADQPREVVAVVGDWPATADARNLAERVRTTGTVQFATLRQGREALLLVGAPAGSGQVLLGAIPVRTLPLAEIATAVPGALVLVDAEGRPLHHEDPGGLLGDEATLTTMMGMMGRMMGPGSMPHGSMMPFRRHDMMVTAAVVEPPGWTLLAVEDAESAATVGLSTVTILPFILFVVTLVALLTVYFGWRAVVRPLQELAHRATRVAWGDYEAAAAPVGGVREVDDLRATLDQMARRIRGYQAGMRDYLGAVTQAQEAERTRLARELHDDTVQALIALKQRAQLARKALGRDPERAAERLDELSLLIDHELTSLRRLIADLRPIYLEELGFIPALEMLVHETETTHGPSVFLAVQGEPVRLAPDLELAAFRIVQQALSNAVQHAAAHHIGVTVLFTATELQLFIQDDGCGFNPPEHPTDFARSGHFGLMGMYERATLHGGSLTLHSTPGQGTTVTVRLPLVTAARAE
jgi:signal transduction histidine kinase